MTPAEANKKIVAMTAETMQLAEQILELRNSEGDTYNPEKASLLEVISVANLIVNMSVAGMYKVPKEERVGGALSQSVIDGIVAALGPVIDAKIRIALAPKPIPIELRPAAGSPNPPAVPPPGSPS